jgi:hypothetical protein
MFWLAKGLLGVLIIWLGILLLVYLVTGSISFLRVMFTAKDRKN